MKSRLLGILSLLVLVLALTACDGSSGSSSSDSGSASGAVAAAPLEGAKVFFENPDPAGKDFQIGETGPNGTIDFSPYKENLSKIDFSKPAIIYSTGGRNFVKADNAVPFAGKLKGVMASASSEVYLTPANTLVAALVKKGKSLADAKARVKKIVQVEMGLGEGIDPFAKPLPSSPELLVQSEMASQAIFAVIGISDDTAGNLDEHLATIAQEMVEQGKPFASAAATIPSCSIKAGESMFSAIHKDGGLLSKITSAATTVLTPVAGKEDSVDLGEISAVATKTEEAAQKVSEDTTSPSSIQFNSDGKSFSLPKNVAFTDVEETKFSVKVLNSKNDPLDEKVTYVATGSDYITFDEASKTFTFNINKDEFDVKNLPLVLKVVVTSETDPTVTATIETTVIGNDAIAVNELFINQGDYLFTVAPSVDDEIIYNIGAENFIASVILTNDKADINDLVEMQFFAPKASKFVDYLEGNGNTDTRLIIKSFTKDGDLHDAKIDSDVKLIVEVDEDTVDSKITDMTVKAFDVVTGNELASLTEEVAFIPEGNNNNIINVALGESSINADSNNVLTFSEENIDSDGYFKADGELKLKGSVQTWSSKYEPISELGEDAKDAIFTNGKFVLINTSKKETFRHSDGSYYQNVDIAKEAITISKNAPHTLEVDIKSVLEYKPAKEVGTDTLKLVYKPEGKESVPTSGGLLLEFDISEKP